MVIHTGSACEDSINVHRSPLEQLSKYDFFVSLS